MKRVKQPHGGELVILEKGETNNPNGRPVGVKNRSTIARKVLEMKGLIPEKALIKLRSVFPEITNEMTMEEVMTIIQAGKAVTSRDTFAYNALLDSAYGKPDKKVEMSGELKYSNLSDDEVRQRIAELRKKGA